MLLAVCFAFSVCVTFSLLCFLCLRSLLFQLVCLALLLKFVLVYVTLLLIIAVPCFLCCFASCVVVHLLLMFMLI